MNLELGKTVRDLIKAHPDQHDQSTWTSRSDENPIESCGTTACIAGWTAAARGFTLAQLQKNGFTFEGEQCYDIETWAREALDLDYDDASDLFYTFDEVDAMEKLENLIADEERERARAAEPAE